MRAWRAGSSRRTCVRWDGPRGESVAWSSKKATTWWAPRLSEDYRLTARGRKGVINMKTTPRVGKVVGILSVKEDSDLMIITKQGQIIRIDSGEIRQAGRSTQGVKLVNVEPGDQVAAASLIPDTETNGGQEDLPLQ